MKRLFIIFLVIFFGLVSSRPVFAANFLQGTFLSAFRSAQALVEGVRTKVTRFLGIREDTFETLPSLRVLSFGDFREFLIGTEREIQWTYENLKESVTKITLLPAGKPPVLLMFLPAKRNASGSDTYSFPVRFLRGTYHIQVCNGETCDITESFSIALPVFEESLSLYSESASTSTFFIPTSTPTSTLPAITLPAITLPAMP